MIFIYRSQINGNKEFLLFRYNYLVVIDFKMCEEIYPNRGGSATFWVNSWEESSKIELLYSELFGEEKIDLDSVTIWRLDWQLLVTIAALSSDDECAFSTCLPRCGVVSSENWKPDTHLIDWLLMCVDFPESWNILWTDKPDSTRKGPEKTKRSRRVICLENRFKRETV